MKTTPPPPLSVSSELILSRWKELNSTWSDVLSERRQKRMREQQIELKRSASTTSAPSASAVPNGTNTLTRLGGTPILDPPPFLPSSSSSSSSSMFNLFLRGLGEAAPPFATEVRSPSGLSRHVLMMSSEATNQPRQVARMIFNDRRLDSSTAAARSTSIANAPFVPQSQSQWRELFRVGQRSSSSPSMPMDSIFQSLLNRSLYDPQPTAASLRNGGSTLITLQTPPATADADSCPICLDNDRTQTWAQFPCCKNFAHEHCARRCLTDRMTCPICRTIIP